MKVFSDSIDSDCINYVEPILHCRFRRWNWKQKRRRVSA